MAVLRIYRCCPKLRTNPARGGYQWRRPAASGAFQKRRLIVACGLSNHRDDRPRSRMIVLSSEWARRSGHGGKGSQSDKCPFLASSGCGRGRVPMATIGTLSSHCRAPCQHGPGFRSKARLALSGLATSGGLPCCGVGDSSVAGVKQQRIRLFHSARPIVWRERQRWRASNDSLRVVGPPVYFGCLAHISATAMPRFQVGPETLLVGAQHFCRPRRVKLVLVHRQEPHLLQSPYCCKRNKWTKEEIPRPSDFPHSLPSNEAVVAIISEPRTAGQREMERSANILRTPLSAFHPSRNGFSMPCSVL
jgi:hypothetical protein